MRYRARVREGVDEPPTLVRRYWHEYKLGTRRHIEMIAKPSAVLLSRDPINMPRTKLKAMDDLEARPI